MSRRTVAQVESELGQQIAELKAMVAQLVTVQSAEVAEAEAQTEASPALPVVEFKKDLKKAFLDGKAFQVKSLTKEELEAEIGKLRGKVKDSSFNSATYIVGKQKFVYSRRFNVDETGKKVYPAIRTVSPA